MKDSTERFSLAECLARRVSYENEMMGMALLNPSYEAVCDEAGKWHIQRIGEAIPLPHMPT
ncbi:hypothetical protein EGJ50_11425 [Pseudomonas luteola]|nr:hypothetical protein EGJ50_11425 [Pseudomonas luteola]